jgi:hypothetical protein
MLQAVGDLIEKQQPTEWLVRDTIATRAIHLLYGPNLGYLREAAVRMAIAVASGQRDKWPEVVQGDVVYHALNIGSSLLAREFESRGVTPEHELGIYIDTDRSGDFYVNTVADEAAGHRLLILDHWYGLEALNEPELMGLRPEEKTLSRIRMLRNLAVDRNLAVVVLAEGAKRDQAVRGTSMVLGAFDGWLNVEWERQGRALTIQILHRACVSHNLTLTR